MAILRHKPSGRVRRLEPETTIGRSASCALTLGEPYVSGLHASIRWSGDRWYVCDLGSRNGTRFNGELLKEGERRALATSVELSFGHADQTWVLADDSPPEALIKPVGGGDPLHLTDGLVALPDQQDPVATVFLDMDGTLVLETDAGRRRLTQNDTFEVAGTRYGILVPQVLPPTTTIQGMPLRVRDIELALKVSQNEEHVGVEATVGGMKHPQRDRLHNYVLLVLARERLADRAAGVSERDEGWIPQAELLQKLRTDQTRLNLDVFRIRRQFGDLGAVDAANIIERRFDSKEMRIGTARLSVLPSTAE